MALRYYNPKHPREALEKFDEAFGKRYVGGGIGRTPISAYKYYMEHPTYKPGVPYGHPRLRGWQGFKPEFRDTAFPDDDITHHVTAYIDAGINDQLEAALLHRAMDNAGDARAGKAAYSIGETFLRHPDQLRNIGVMIRSTLCAPVGKK